MRTYYDDNFGAYDIQDEDDLAFYHEMQRRSVWKKCGACGRKVKLKPDYGICNACATKLEQGFDCY